MRDPRRELCERVVRRTANDSSRLAGISYTVLGCNVNNQN